MTTTDARGWITALIKAMHEETSGSWPDPEYKDEVYSALEMAIKALENHDTFMKYAYSQGKQDALSQEPCDDTVSRGVFEQVMWERNIAIEQLHELGYELGQKIEPCDDAISRKDAIIQISWDFPTLELPKIKESLDKLPSVTQKSGKWLITPMSNIAHCSECDYLFKDIPASVVEHFKYCPNCGAKMESEVRNEQRMVFKLGM